MKLHEAMPALYAGRKARREAWEPEWDNSLRWAWLPAGLVNNPVIEGQFMAIANYLTDGNTVGRPALEFADLSADDWIVEGA
jgi:hypothetical protein